MKILLHYPQWANRWIPYINKELSRYDLKVTHTAVVNELKQLSEEADVLISMWANEFVGYWSQRFPNKKIICYMRRYEFWEKALMQTLDFNHIDAIIFCNNWYKEKFDATGLPPKTYLVYNGIKVGDFPLQPFTGDHKIAFVGQQRSVKNFPLALQVLAELPEKYTLHHIGLSASESLDKAIWSYTGSMGLADRVTFYQPLNPQMMVKWYKDKDFIMSTSLNEGNPNCLTEAMSMGIKPIIHAWPGAINMYPPEFVWTKIHKAVELITQPKYNSLMYREYVKTHFNYNNIKQIHGVIKDVVG